MLLNPWPDVIHQLRRKKGLTQEQAAESADVAANTWSRWEQPGFRPREKQLEKILLGLDCTADELGAAFSMAMASRYLEQPSEEEAETERWSEEDIRRAAAAAEDPFHENLLGKQYEPWPIPAELVELADTAIDRSFTVAAASSQILAELLRHWPRFEATATDKNRRQIMLVQSYIHEMLDLCLSMSEELSEIRSPPDLPHS